MTTETNQCAMMFQRGDKAVYPGQGVAEVIAVDELDVHGSRQQFYILRVVDTNRKLMVPVANAAASGLRRLGSESEICAIFDVLRANAASDHQNWSRRYRSFMDKIQGGALLDLAEVLRDLSRLKQTKPLSFGERRVLETVGSLLVREIATAREQTDNQVKTEIEATFLLPESDSRFVQPADAR